MNNLTIQDWGSIGELVGSIAVLVSVVHLTIQFGEKLSQAHGAGH